MDPAAQELISRHNEQVRELIVRDIDALEDKLNVKRQVSQKADEALDKVKGTLGMNQRNQSEGWTSFVRHNAAPLAAVGLGGAVLAKNLRDRAATDTQTTTSRLMTESSYVPQAEGDSGGGIKETAAAKVGDAKEKVSDVTGTAKEKVSDVTDTAKLKAMDAKDTVADAAGTAKVKVADAKDMVIEHVPTRQQASRMAHDHGQVLGLAALAAGAAVGTFMPRTRAEERRLAPVQAQVKDKASELVEGSVEKAKETADRAAEAISVAAETAKEEFAESGEEPPSGDLDVTSDLPDVTRANRITGSRPGVTSGIDGSGGGTTL